MILRIAQRDYLDIRVDLADENGDPLYLEPGETLMLHSVVRTPSGEYELQTEGIYDANDELHFLVSDLPDICPGIYRFGVDLLDVNGHKWCLCRPQNNSLIVEECSV